MCCVYNCICITPQTCHVCSTLKESGNYHFHVVLTWNTYAVFGKILYVSPFLSNIPITISLKNTIEPFGIKRKLRKV